METALTLAATGVDSTVVAAGLLHDAIDDSNLSLTLLRGALGEDVASLVIGVRISLSMANSCVISQLMNAVRAVILTVEEVQVLEQVD